MLFPERLRQLRTQSGMKQREVAQALGIDIPMYSRYEHGERRPKREQVVKIAKLFHADANELIALWLAFNAINEIGTDRLATLALRYLRDELEQDLFEEDSVLVQPQKT
ncbi:MAG: helix-turn-helix transcriptional regulator, partial [Muribaculaceae bacterium]|nr:helix-turn-helix transcriptional regulator [Muribaculaceae bacterium]